MDTKCVSICFLASLALSFCDFFRVNTTAGQGIVQGSDTVYRDYELPSNSTKEQERQYYIDNHIFPSNASEDATTILYQDDVENHLISRFGGVLWALIIAFTSFYYSNGVSIDRFR